MFNKYMILTREFRNCGENEQVSGFQLKIRIPYYRGVPLSLVDTIQLSVDGETFTRDQLSFSVADRSYSLNELQKTTGVEWFFGDPATLTVAKPGGLASGMHTVQLGIVIRKSYWPKKDPDNLYGFLEGTGALDMTLHEMEMATKQMTLV